jgi:hypothetical protein
MTQLNDCNLEIWMAGISLLESFTAKNRMTPDGCFAAVHRAPAAQQFLELDTICRFGRACCLCPPPF